MIMDTSNTLLETQKEIERIFNKNQLMFKVKSEFKKEPEIKEIMDKFNIPNDFRCRTVRTPQKNARKRQGRIQAGSRQNRAKIAAVLRALGILGRRRRSEKTLKANGGKAI